MAHLEQGGGGVEVVGGQRQRLLGRAHGVAELHPLVPDRVPDAVGQGADVGAPGVEEHDVDVGLQAELGSAVAADRDEGDVAGAALRLGGGEELGEPVVDEVAVGPAERPADQGAVALERPPAPDASAMPQSGRSSAQIEPTRRRAATWIGSHVLENGGA